MNTKDFMFSASSFKDYLQCGLKFKYSKVDKKERTETATHHRWFGSLVHSLIYHSVAEYDGTSKNLILRNNVRKKETLDLLEDLWNENPKNNEGEIILKSLGEKPIGKFSRGKLASLGSNDEDIDQTSLEEGWLEEAKKMVENGIDIISDIHEIVELEKKTFYHVKGYKFMGFIDVLAKNSEGEYEFYDFKTSWDRSYDLNNDFQFFGYAKAISEDKKLGIDEKYFPTGYWVYLRKKELLPYELKKEKFWEMIRLTEKTMMNMEANIFLPNYGSPLCKFCDFRHICYGEDEQVWSRR